MLQQLYRPLIVTKNLDPPNLESDVSRRLFESERLGLLKFMAAIAPMYSASTVEAATVGCSLLDQLTALRA
jgi:hypothetical protein